MRVPRNSGISFLRIVLVALLALGMAPRAARGAGPAIELPSDPSAVVVSYRSIPGELAGPGASLRVHADGRVVTHYPAPYARAGTYERRLSASEVEGLVQSLAAEGVLDFDADAVKEAQHDAAAARRAAAGGPATVSMVSDPDLVEIEVRLARFQPVGGAERRDLVKTVRWKNLAVDRRESRGIAAIDGLAAAVDALTALMEQPGTRID